MALKDASENSYTVSVHFRFIHDALRDCYLRFAFAQEQYEAAGDARTTQEWYAANLGVVNRVAVEYFNAAILAHALTEGIVNSTLAVMLGRAGNAELFRVFDRAKLRDKIEVIPRILIPKYSFPRGSALGETLHCLLRERNNIVHYKSFLQVGAKAVFKGSEFVATLPPQQISWGQRYFSFPYDLAEFLRAQDNEVPWVLHVETDPIPRYKPHASWKSAQ